MNLLLTPLLILQGLTSTLFFDGVRVNSVFYDRGEIVRDQGFLIELEDFAHIQSFLSTRQGSCEKRLVDIQQKHANKIVELQEDCRKRTKELELSLDRALQDNRLLKEDLEEERDNKKLWIIAGAGTSLTLATFLFLK